MNIGQIKHPYFKIKPSPALEQYIKNIEYSQDLPPVIAKIILKNTPPSTTKRQPSTATDYPHYIRTLKLKKGKKKKTQKPIRKDKIDANEPEQHLSLFELDWLLNYIQNHNKITNKKVYLHEMLKDAQIIYLKHDQLPRNEDMERIYNELQALDASRRLLPKNTIGYQLRLLIAIFHFIMSVLAGFAFGFLGVELIMEDLDLEFRLLLGIICSLVIALAELYFFAKKLNENLQYESEVRKNK